MFSHDLHSHYHLEAKLSYTFGGARMDVDESTQIFWLMFGWSLQC